MELWKYSSDKAENDARVVENCIAILNGTKKPYVARVCVPCNGSGRSRPVSYAVSGEVCWNCNGKGHRHA